MHQYLNHKNVYSKHEQHFHVRREQNTSDKVKVTDNNPTN